LSEEEREKKLSEEERVFGERERQVAGDIYRERERKVRGEIGVKKEWEREHQRGMSKK
jgi:hypothetical protein